MSLDTFSRHVQPDLRLVRVGRKVIVPIAELERYVHENAAVALRDETR